MFERAGEKERKKKTMNSDIKPESESKKTMKDEAEEAAARVHTNNEMKSSTQEMEEMMSRTRLMRAFVEGKDPSSKVLAIYNLTSEGMQIHS